MPNVMEKHFIFVVINAGRNSCQNQRELSAKAGLEDGVKKRTIFASSDFIN